MPVTITVFYPTDSEATFNLDYYVSKHMPMVFDLMGPKGMKGVFRPKSPLRLSVTPNLFCHSFKAPGV